MGDVMGEVNKRRGRVFGHEPGRKRDAGRGSRRPHGGNGRFRYLYPSVHSGRGTFTFEFARYEDAPAQVAQKVIEEAKAAQEGAGE